MKALKIFKYIFAYLVSFIETFLQSLSPTHQSTILCQQPIEVNVIAEEVPSNLNKLNNCSHE